MVFVQSSYVCMARVAGIISVSYFPNYVHYEQTVVTFHLRTPYSTCKATRFVAVVLLVINVYSHNNSSLIDDKFFTPAFVKMTPKYVHEHTDNISTYAHAHILFQRRTLLIFDDTPPSRTVHASILEVENAFNSVYTCSRLMSILCIGELNDTFAKLAKISNLCRLCEFYVIGI